MTNIFTDGNAGIRALVEKTNWKITAHNRWWSANTDYAKANGGAYDFFVDPEGRGDMAVPVQQEFWEWLLTSSVTEWGLTTYEQDWLYNELEGNLWLLNNVTLGRQWLMQMGAGAQAAGVSIQLCMAYPRHALQSVEMPTATQIRASDDHVPGRTGGSSTTQWNLAHSSLLAWAIGLAPFKDNYWSSAQQPGSSCGNNATEVTPSLHNAASTFSAGPVTPGDGVGFSDVPQIMRSATASGQLLQPSRPMTALDASMAGAVKGTVMATYSAVSGLLWDHVLGANLPSAYAVTVGDLAAIRADLPLRSAAAVGTLAAFVLPSEPAAAAGSAVAYSLDADSLEPASLQVQPFDGANGIPLKACGLADFQVWHTAPVLPSGYALLGELSKWVPVSEARFSDVQSDAAQASVAVRGQAGELVTVSWWDSAAQKAVQVACTLPEGGSAVVSVPSAVCS
jgi:hypothetical protein